MPIDREPDDFADAKLAINVYAEPADPAAPELAKGTDAEPAAAATDVTAGFIEDEPHRLHLDGYDDRVYALTQASHGCPDAYSAIAGMRLSNQKSLPVEGFMLFGSFVSRMRGLHEGVVRELTSNNPHATLPLSRAWLETITVGLYTLRHPIYVQQLLYGPGDNRPARKSFEAMFHAVREDAPQLRLVYRALSDFSHFGPLGVWNAHTPDSVDDRRVSWTDAPRWRSPLEFQAACAQAHELAIAGLATLDALGCLLLPRDEPAT